MVGQSDFVTFAVYFTRVRCRFIMYVGHATQPGRTMLMGLVSKAMRKQISLRHRSTENLKLKFQHFFYVLGGTLKRILFIVDTAA